MDGAKPGVSIAKNVMTINSISTKQIRYQWTSFRMRIYALVCESEISWEFTRLQNHLMRKSNSTNYSIPNERDKIDPR